MKCNGCHKDLFNKKRYFTLVCNTYSEKTNHDAIFTFFYCDPMCIALDWQCMEA